MLALRYIHSTYKFIDSRLLVSFGFIINILTAFYECLVTWIKDRLCTLDHVLP